MMSLTLSERLNRHLHTRILDWSRVIACGLIGSRFSGAGVNVHLLLMENGYRTTKP